MNPDADRILPRWAAHANIGRTRVLDDTTARQLIDRVLVRQWTRALAEEALTGDGSTTATRQQLRGILNTAGVGTVAVAAPNRVGALLTAIATVENAGFPGPHAVVLHPADKSELLGQADFRRDRFPTLDAVIGFDRIAAGTAYVGQIGAGRLLSTPLMINVSPDHASNITTAIVTMQPAAFLDIDLPYPGSMCLITGM